MTEYGGFHRCSSLYLFILTRCRAYISMHTDHVMIVGKLSH